MTHVVPAESGGLLDAIAASVRTAVAGRTRRHPIEVLAREAETRQPAGARFRDALGRPGRVNIIAECKRRSPARGVLARSYTPAARARVYDTGGAAAISVLTEPSFFDGALSHLEEVRAATGLPLLRKDFVVEEYQLVEARAAGADAVLLIAALLGPATLKRFIRRAEGLGLAALVEVHSSPELAAAGDAGATVIGINSRNLRTLDVDLRVCEALIPEAPPGAIMVAESGVRSREDVARLAAMGYHAFLVGEHLMTAADPGAALCALLAPPDAAGLTGPGQEA